VAARIIGPTLGGINVDIVGSIEEKSDKYDKFAAPIRR